MRKLILVATCVLMTSTVQAADVTNDKEFCNILSQYAWLVLTGRFEQGLTEEQQYPSLASTQNIHPDMEVAIRKVIKLVYLPDFPVTNKVADIAYYTTSVRDTCLVERAKRH